MPDRHPVFALSDAFVDEYVELVPMAATRLGIPGHDGRWGDSSPDGYAEVAALFRDVRTRLAALPPPETPEDELATYVLERTLRVELADIEHDEHLRQVGHITGFFQEMLRTLQGMPVDTEAGWTDLHRRLTTIDRPLADWLELLDLGAERGVVSARRQVESTIAQLRAAIGEGGGLASLKDAMASSPVVDEARLRVLDQAMRHAGQQIGLTADRIERVHLPVASEVDGVGPERYARQVDRLLGTQIDVEETYAWAWAHLADLQVELEDVARQIDSSLTLDEVVALLRDDPDRSLDQDDFVEAMQERQARAIADLADTHFDIPDVLRNVDVKLVPPGGPRGAYYMPPSEDLTRPGTLWWSRGDLAPVPLFFEVAVAYHEGFPGHHLQIGLSKTYGDRLSRVHRMLMWVPGFREGWAMYSELLMRELGYYEKPDYVLGQLTAAALRTCRVILDLGLHLGLRIPDDAPFHPGEAWTFDLAVELLGNYFIEPAYADSEVTRYLGWPAQAITYKLGERLLLEIRDAYRAATGAAYDEKHFHHLVLAQGDVELDRLRTTVMADADRLVAARS